MTKQYIMTNSNLKGKVTSPMVNDMEVAVKYFQENFPIEFIGCNIKQIKGINPQWGADFMCNVNWATQEQYDAFVAKYGKAPKTWQIFTKEEQEKMHQAEYEKEMRKARYED